MSEPRTFDDDGRAVWRTLDFGRLTDQHPGVRCDDYRAAVVGALGMRRYTWPDGRIRTFRQEPDYTWRETTGGDADV